MTAIFIQPNQLPWFFAPLAEPLSGDIFNGSSVLDFAIIGTIMTGGLITFGAYCRYVQRDDKNKVIGADGKNGYDGVSGRNRIDG